MDRQPLLEGERYLLRPLTAEDWSELYAVASDPAVWEQHPMTDRWRADVFRVFFDDALAKDGALAIIDKRRPKANESQVMHIIGEVEGRTCVLVDDIVDTAGTLCKAAEVLMENGAAEVHSYITHGVMSGPAVERVANSVMKSLVLSDSIEPTQAVLDAPNIRIVPTAPMFAQAILNIWIGTSVSSLFDTETLEPIYDGLL